MASAEGEAMNISDIILAIVALALIANAIALVRHWRLMREAQIGWTILLCRKGSSINS
jgi:hypothetical protein